MLGLFSRRRTKDRPSRKRSKNRLSGKYLNRRFRRPVIEPLEERRLLAVDTTFEDGVLRLDTDNGEDIVVTAVEGLVKINGENPSFGPLEAEDVFEIYADQDFESQVIDVSAAMQAPFVNLKAAYVQQPLDDPQLKQRIEQYAVALFGANWENTFTYTTDDIERMIRTDTWQDVVYSDSLTSIARAIGKQGMQQFFDSKLEGTDLPALDVSHLEWWEVADDVGGGGTGSDQNPPIDEFPWAGGGIGIQQLGSTSTGDVMIGEAKDIGEPGGAEGGDLNVDDTTVHESFGLNHFKAQFTVSLDNAEFIDGFSVDWETQDGSATWDPMATDNDYRGGSGTLSWGEGDVGDGFYLLVPIEADSVTDPGETFNLVLTEIHNDPDGSEGSQIADGTGTATIIEDGPPTIEIRGASQQEGDNKSLRYTVEMSYALTEGVTVGYIIDTLESTATTADYDTPEILEVTIPENSTYAQIVIDLVNDTDEEFDEGLVVELTSIVAGGGVLHSDPDKLIGYGIILDDDRELTEFAQTDHSDDSCPVCSSVQQSTGSDSGSPNISAEAPGAGLNHNSETNPHPIHMVDVALPDAPSGKVLFAAEARLIIAGMEEPIIATYADASGFTEDNLRFAIMTEVDAILGGKSAGTYDWTMGVRFLYADPEATYVPNEEPDGAEYKHMTLTGQRSVVGRGDSAFGNRWWLDGLDYLVADQTGGSSGEKIFNDQHSEGGGIARGSRNGMTLVSSDGSSAFFQLASGQWGTGAATFTTPDGYHSTLKRKSDGTYVLSQPDGSRQEFSSTGLITGRFDPLGNATTYEYTNADGGVVSNDIWKITDPFGLVTTYGYVTDTEADNYGKIATITDHAGRVTTLDVDADGVLRSITTPDPDDLTGAEMGNLDPLTTTFDYYTDGDMDNQGIAGTRLLKSVTDNNGITTEYDYDPDSLRVTTITENNGNVRTMEARQTRGLAEPFDSMDPDYNEFFAPLASGTDGNPNGEARYKSSSGIQGRAIGTDRFGYVTSVTDELGNTTTYVRDADGQVTQITTADPDGEDPRDATVTSYAYQADGYLTQITNESDSSTQDWTYQSITSSITGLAITQLASYSDELGRTIKYIADEDTGSITDIVIIVGLDDSDPGNSETDDITTSFEYTATTGDLPAGLLTSVTEQISPGVTRETQYTYDDDPQGDFFGLLESVTFAVGTADEATIAYTYDTVTRNLIAVEDPLGRVTKYTYDHLDRVTQIILPDPEGDDQNDSNNPTWTYTYCACGRLKTETDPEGATTTYEYDDLGLLEQLILDDPDPNDQVTENPTWTYTRDPLGRVVLATDPLDRVTQYVYDDVGNLRKIFEPDPDQADSTITDSSLLDPFSTDQHATRPTWIFDYDNTYQVTTVTDPQGRVTTYDYDARMRLASVLLPDPDDNPGTPNQPGITYAYDVAGQLTAMTDPRGALTSYDYDDLGRLITLTMADPDLDPEDSQNDGPLSAPVYSYEYYDTGLLKQVTDPLGRLTEYEYDYRDRLTTLTLADPDLDPQDPQNDGPLSAPQTAFTYDAAGQLETLTDPRGAVTSYDYDDLGRLTSLTLPDPDLDPEDSQNDGPLSSPVWQYEYDFNGNLTTLIDPESLETVHEYDDLNRLIKTTQPEPTSGAGQPEWEYTYYTNGQLKTTQDPLDRVTTYEYDRLNRLQTVTQPDPDGTSGSETVPFNTYEYDLLGNVTQVTNALDHTTSYDYDDLDRLASQTDAEMRVTEYTYDIAGNLETLTDPEDNVTTWAYDYLGRITDETNELDDTRSYHYDAASRLVQMVDRNGRGTQYVYDELDRLVTEQWFADDDFQSTPTDALSYTYDAAGNLLTAATAHAASADDSDYAFTYDYLGRTDEATFDGPFSLPQVVLAYDYNSLGLVTQVAETIDAATGATTAYTYDDLYRLASVTQSGGASGLTATDRRADFAWNNAGQLTDIARYAGLDAMSDPLVAATHFDYETGGRLASITHTLNDGSPGTQIDYGYAWDAANRLTEIDSSQDGLSTFDHDDAGQLTSEDHDGTANPHTADHDYAYDDNGNRLTVTVDGGPPEDWETDPNNRLLFDGTYTYTYDAEGNRTARFIDTNDDGVITTNVDTDVTTYHWDHRNRLTAIAFDTDGDGQLDKRVAYTYDPFDQLIGKTVDDDGDGNPDRAEAYVWDRGQILLDFVDDNAGNGLDDFVLARRYLHGPLVDQVLAQENVAAGPGNENVDWLLADHQGTVRDVVRWDDTAGETELVEHYQYDAFGNLTAIVDAAGMVISTDRSDAVTRYQYTGRDWDADSGLQYNRARWYDPATGRWISEDPIGFAGGDANLARYVGNGATVATDPSGLDWVDDYYEYAFGEDSWFVGLGDGIKGLGSALNPFTIPSDFENAFAQMPNDVENAKRLWNNPSDYCEDRIQIVSEGVAEQFSTPRGAGEAYVLVSGILLARKLPASQGPMAQLEAKLVARTMTRAEWQAYSQMSRAIANGRVPVSRWGEPILRPQAWVMPGHQTPGNYACSFKWDPLRMNEVAGFGTGSTFYVNPQQVAWPSGWGIDGRWKGIFGQRIYTGPETHVPVIVK